MNDELLKRVPRTEQPLLPGVSESALPGTPSVGSADALLNQKLGVIAGEGTGAPSHATLYTRTPLTPRSLGEGGTLVYDGSFEGLLCGLNQLLMNQVVPREIVSESRYQPAFFEEISVVQASEAEAGLTWGKITSFYSRESQRNIATAFAADSPRKELVIYNYLVYGLEVGKDLDRCHSIDAVREMHELCQKVRCEAHRLKGLLRFKKTDSGVFYAPFESDHLVICQLASFFKHRLNDQEWLLHDKKRGLMIYWDTKELHQAEPEMGNCEPTVAEEEEHYQALWQTFFRSVCIKERLNTKLQRQLMPRRYWAYLTEDVISKH